MSFQKKYMKYKSKYLSLKKQMLGGGNINVTITLQDGSSKNIDISDEDSIINQVVKKLLLDIDKIDIFFNGKLIDNNSTINNLELITDENDSDSDFDMVGFKIEVINKTTKLSTKRIPSISSLSVEPVEGKCITDIKDIAVLVHGTSFDYCFNMIKMNQITAHPGDPVRTINDRQIILNKGVYFRILFNCHKLQSIQKICGNEIIMVFSKKLINKRNDFHVTNNWVGGMVFAPADITHVNQRRPDIKSYNKSQLGAFVSENKDIQCGEDSVWNNEIVFTENVDLDFLKEIWICDFDYLKNIMESKKQPDNSFYKRITG